MRWKPRNEEERETLGPFRTLSGERGGDAELIRPEKGLIIGEWSSF